LISVASTRKSASGWSAAIERAAVGDPRADIRKLAGSDEHRPSVGDWRVVLSRGRAYGR
jgi:hypothetical protein